MNDPSDILYSQFNYNWMVFSNSINLDYKFHKYGLFRTEIKYMNSQNDIFQPSRNNYLGAFVAMQIKI